MTDPAELNRIGAEAPTTRRGRRRKNPLVDAIAAIAPAERQAVIAAALAEVEQAERRDRLLEQVQMLDTDQLARLLQAAQ